MDDINIEDINFFLKKEEYLYIATTDGNGRPNVAPKFLIKAEKGMIYLADFVFGKTWTNLKTMPQVSLAAVNLDSLMGYQLNGTAELLSEGDEFDKTVKELDKRQIKFSANRLINAVKYEKKFDHYEMTFPDRVVIFKVTVKEIVKIEPSGKLDRFFC